MGGFAEYEQYDALGLGDLVRRKEIQPSELLEAAIERIERINPQLNAVILKLYDRARQAVGRPVPDGPFTGVPYLLKDMVAHRGTTTTFGNAFMKRINFKPQESHEVVARAERAGLIVVGKTNACELGLLPTTEPAAYGPTANPWDPSRSPGGSSGGSASAVAAGLVPMAHGNDGGGSIRIPASACGLFGFKPSRGRNPGLAADPPAGIAVEHCLSRTVRDSAALLDITRGPRLGDRWWAPEPSRPYLDDVSEDPPPLKIAFATKDLMGKDAHRDCVEAVRSTAALCEDLGHHLEEASPDIDGERYYDAFGALWTVMPSFFLKVIAREVRKKRFGNFATRLLGEQRALRFLTQLSMGNWRNAPFEPVTIELASIGEQRSNADLWIAMTKLYETGYEMCRFLSRYDVYMTPVLSTPPVKTGVMTGESNVDWLTERVTTYAAYTQTSNSAGLPAMSMPLFWNDAGLPIGIHFVGSFGDESTLFRLAGQLERARPWRDKYPKL